MNLRLQGVIGVMMLGKIVYGVEVKYKGESYNIESKQIQNLLHLNLYQLKRMVGFKIQINPITKQISLLYGEKKIKLYPGNPWIILDTLIIQSPLPPTLYKNIPFLPLPLVNKLLHHFEGIKLKYQNNILTSYESKVKIKKIIIDPGHGGKDPGAIGYKGLTEKEVCLQVAKLIKKILSQQKEIEVVLLREKDVFVPLKERSKRANQEKGDLFISLHCNAHPKKVKEGVEVYFLSPAKTTWARAVEARENAVLKYEGEKPKTTLESILWDLAQTEFLRESNELSWKIVNSISSQLGNLNRGVKQANFYVLSGVYMPACLVEMEFITNSKWGRRLSQKKYQYKIAQAIVEGIEKFKQWYESRLNE